MAPSRLRISAIRLQLSRTRDSWVGHQIANMGLLLGRSWMLGSTVRVGFLGLNAEALDFGHIRRRFGVESGR